MPRPNVKTRSILRQEEMTAAAALPCHPVIASNIARVCLLQTEETCHPAAAVCTAWRDEFMKAVHLEYASGFGQLKAGKRVGRFDRPHCATFLPSGDIAIADCDNFKIQFWSRYGTYEREISLGGGTSCPTCVICAKRSLFVVAHGAHKLIKLRLNGYAVSEVGGWGGGDGKMRHPWGCCIAKNLLYVVDSGNQRVCVFDPSTLTYLFSFGCGGRAAGQLCEPRGIASHGDELIIADAGANRLQCFTLNGEPTRTLGREGSAPGCFRRPSGVAVCDSLLYVTETDGKRMQVLRMDGLPLQIVRASGAALSGVCADEEHVIVTALESTSASDAHFDKHQTAIHRFDVTDFTCED